MAATDDDGEGTRERWDLRTVQVPEQPDEVSPGGGAEIRKLLSFPMGELTHVIVPAGKVSLPSRVYPSSEWFFIWQGHGELWDGASDRVTLLRPRRSVRIAPGTPFQYRASDEDHLEVILAAMPLWHPAFHGVLGHGGEDVGPWRASIPGTHFDTRGELVPRQQLGIDVFDPVDDPSRHYLAPDSSEIWTLGEEDAGGLALCDLRSDAISDPPVFHRRHTEIWYVLNGTGQLSRRYGTASPAVVELLPRTTVDIAPGVTFQFRAGPTGLRMLLLTMPKWTGAEAATPDKANQHWFPLGQRP